MGKRGGAKADPAIRYVRGRVTSEVAEGICQRMDEIEIEQSNRGQTMLPWVQDCTMAAQSLNTRNIEHRHLIHHTACFDKLVLSFAQRYHDRNIKNVYIRKINCGC